MVIKVYISGMSGSKEVKKRQQRVSMIMDSKHIPYTIIDITEPGQEGEKDFMQKNSEHNGGTISDPTPRHPLPPQMFNDAEYCGDYDDFDLANEIDNLEVFLKMEAPKPAVVSSTSEVSPDEQKNGTGEDQEDQSQVTTTEVAEGDGDDDENKENKTEEGANEANFSEDAVDEESVEQRELLEAATAMGKREDATEEEDEEQQEEDVELAEEDDVSGKLVDTDDPMLAEQEEEEEEE